MSLLRADAIAIPLADESVDLIVTSPPYFALRSYTDGGEHYAGQIGSEPTPQDFLEALWDVTAECRRVLKPTGSLWVNLGDKYASSPGQGNPGLAGTERKRHRRPDFGGVREKSLMGLPWRYAIGCIDQLDLILRAEVIWGKPNGLPESVTDRVRRSHEQWFHFTKEPRYFAGVDEIREPQATAGERHEGRSGYVNAADAPGGEGVARSFETRALNPPGKLPGSVWTIPSEPLKVPDWLGVDHFAAFPQEWPRRIILGWSPSGYCVACDEPRRAVVKREFHGEYNSTEGQQQRTRSAMSGGTAKVTLGKTDDIERTITGYSCACDAPTAPTRPAVVLDPFGGTGTVAMVARALGRYPVHIDLSADYLRLARWRIYDSGHAAKSTARTDRERQGVLL